MLKFDFVIVMCVVPKNDVNCTFVEGSWWTKDWWDAAGWSCL
jgi:hypothetical protein